jgi:hypothetical protein
VLLLSRVVMVQPDGARQFPYLHAA